MKHPDPATTGHDQLVAQALTSLEAQARRPGDALRTEAACANWFRLKLGSREHEVFAAAWLDLDCRLIGFEELARGGLTGIYVPVREVVKAALRHNAARAVFALNRPSGSAMPSNDEFNDAKKLTDALALVDVHVLDHFIVSAHFKPLSMRKAAWQALMAARKQSQKQGRR